MEENIFEIIFDGLLYQISKGNTVENILEGNIFVELEQVKEWKSKFGYTFNIYSNDHFINGKPHFHFDNKSKKIACKISFQGEVFESNGIYSIDKNVLKALCKFLESIEIQRCLIDLWNRKNPDLLVKL